MPDETGSIIITDKDKGEGKDDRGASPPPEAPAILEVDTAFIVFRTRAGDIQITGDLNAPLTADRQPSRDDVRGHCAVVCQDLQTQDVAELTSNMMIGKAAAAQRQAMEMRAAQQLQAQIGDPTRLPPGLQHGRG